MKKFLLILFISMIGFFGVSNNVSAQSYYYNTTEFAIKYKTAYGWGDWSDWEKCVCLVTIDTDEETIKIYSKKIQTYHIVSTGEAPYDPDGEQIKFLVVDQDGDRGYVRLRVQNNGTSQIYVDFSDVSWVYNVIRVKQ